MYVCIYICIYIIMYIFVEPSLHCFGDWHTTYWLYNDWVTCCYIITCLCFKRHVLPWRAFLHVVHLDMLLRGCCIAAFSGTAGLSSAASAAMAAQPQGVISGLLHICYGTHTHTFVDLARVSQRLTSCFPLCSLCMVDTRRKEPQNMQRARHKHEEPCLSSLTAETCGLNILHLPRSL